MSKHHFTLILGVALALMSGPILWHHPFLSALHGAGVGLAVGAAIEWYYLTKEKPPGV